ncbi:copper amine oxidase N-terminal domain-containing protein [Paenibacillus agaridevorans]|uniref:copper amine oxidase N-terminal domain-containing protein n=1 Tax=Paenibacillus agaridevorans TaxID=171404 RepID=UPI001BE447D4|nr:copper amine oxidase N-terminal domain-containing protein [Paenibacillus agaridevorans]
MMKTHKLAKTLLAVSLSFGAVLAAAPAPAAYAAEVAAVKIDTAAQAIDRANALHLIPAAAKADAKLVDGIWEITFRGEQSFPRTTNPYLAGFIKLQAKDGKVTEYAASLQSDYVVEYPSDPNDESTFKFTIEEVRDIASKFVEQQNWTLDVQWMDDPYPISDYIAGREFHTARMHIIRYDRSHNGIRDGSNGGYVTVDRVTGDVRAYSVYWKEQTYSPNSAQNAAGLISLNEAANRFYSAVDPFLKWQAIYDPEQPRLIYALHPQYLMTYDGKFPKEYQWENPTIPEKIKPAYSSVLAKKRLLSMYDLNLEYVGGKLTYKLRLKPEINFFQEGLQPSIDANTGAWLDFLNHPLEKPLPDAGEWLEQAAPFVKAGYAAAFLWDNELLRLENEPFIQNAYTLVPFRELLTKLGAKIGWDPVARKVTASKDGTTIVLTVDSDTAIINGETKKLEAPARIKNGRTYVPARLVLETFGADVGWNDESRLVIVKTADNVPNPSANELKKHRYQAQLNWENKALK